MARSLLAVGCLLGLVACSSAHEAENAQPAGISDAAPDPVGEPEPICTRLIGTPPHAPVRPDLAASSAHALVRYFGPSVPHARVDDALVKAIRDGGGNVGESTLTRFAAELDDVCAVRPIDVPLAKVERHGDLAIVTPGRGSIAVPAEARAVAIDVRELPGGPESEQALASVATMLGIGGSLRARVHVRTGLTDEAFTEAALYTDEIVEREVLSLSGGAPKSDSPIVVILVGPRMSPEAARFALTLRSANVVRLAGATLPVAVAEMRWVSGSGTDVAVRTMDVVAGAHRLPDEIQPDLQADDAAILLLDSSTPALPMSVDGASARAAIGKRVDFGEIQGGDVDPVLARAALLSVHGAAKLFFPYFKDVPDGTDERLAETLSTAATVKDRNDVRNVLRRFGNVLQDGHNWTLDAVTVPDWPLPIVLDRVDGAAVVRRSYSTLIKAGDTIVEVGGEDASTWYERELSRTYGATDAFRFWTASGELTGGAIRDLVVASPGGPARPVSIPSKSVSGDLYAGSTRAAGWLTDLGADDVYYFNADGRYAKSDATVQAAFAEASTARGMIIDMRGHPGNEGATWNPYDVVSAIATSDVNAPFYRVPVVDGMDGRSDVMPYQDPTLAMGTFTKPVILITDSMAVSFAEDFSMLLASTGKLRAIVGRPTAGTTGSVTGMQLPGGFQFFFTGMEARWPNGARLFGRGVTPTILVEPTAADYAAGKDPMLLRAIAEVPPAE